MQEVFKDSIPAITTISGIEAVHQFPIPSEEPIKLGLQVLLGVINLIWIMRQHRKTVRTNRKSRKNRKNATTTTE